MRPVSAASDEGSCPTCDRVSCATPRRSRSTLSHPSNR